jgi:hypothetical protein
MSYICISEMPEFDKAKYDEVKATMGLERPGSRWPDGLINHFAGSFEGGGWCIVEEWRSKEDFQRFCDAQPKDPQKMAEMGEVKQRWFEIYHAHYDEAMRSEEMKKAA